MTMNRPTPPSYRTQVGTTLVEVLVAAIVIAVGLLGIASLQVKALQASTNAEMRARATDLAWELADRIRTNSDADQDYVTDGVLSNCDAFEGSNPCSAVPGGGPVDASACSASDIAQQDKLEILCAPDSGIRSVLSGGTLQVTCADVDTSDNDDCTTGSPLTITIGWQVRNDIFGTNTDRVVMTVLPGNSK